MLKKGTYCYVVPSCRASPAAQRAVGKIVEVLAGPHHGAGECGPASYYDVCYQDWVFYCLAEKLRPINDPDADIGNERGSLAA
jgi:hypothetical protein